MNLRTRSASSGFQNRPLEPLGYYSVRLPLQRLLPRREHMQTPTQGRSPRFRVAKPLKGFAPLLFRECRRLSLAREECVRLGWGGHNPNATFLCVAYTLRPVSDEISHFSRQTEMPLIGRSLFTEQTTPCSTVS